MREAAARRQDSPLLLALAVLVPAEAIVGATLLVLAGRRLLAGVAALVAAGVIVIVFPMVQARRGPFAARVLDRAFEASLLSAIAWVHRTTHLRVAALALVCLGVSYLASYERARGEALGYRGIETHVYVGIRESLLVLGLLTGWLEAFLWTLVVLSAMAAGVRVANVASQERWRGAKRGRRAAQRRRAR